MARWVPKEQTTFARRLRREVTAAEAIVCRAPRGSRLAGVKVRRQVPVGPCVAAFLCPGARLIAALDGATHGDPEPRAHDGERDAWLAGQVFRVLSFPDDLAIGETEILVRRIEAVLRTQRCEGRQRGARPPHPPSRREGTRVPSRLAGMGSRFSREGRRGVPLRPGPANPLGFSHYAARR